MRIEPGIPLFKNTRERWFATETLFSFEINIGLKYINISLFVFFFKFDIEIYFPRFYNPYNKRIFARSLKYNEHKSGDIDLWFCNDLRTGISASKHIHCDHTPFRLEINILGFSFMFEKYDHRHWDDDNNRYEE
jgi:hypothetical protein